RVVKPVVDVRDLTKYAALHDPDSYVQSREFGRRLRKSKVWGVAYMSVRHSGGECVAIFRPLALTACVQGAHFAYVWDGRRITWVFEKSNARKLASIESDLAPV
ncbi:MAG: RES family NAD+ phosphorylase, partial [Pseudomonadales bacterium]|nr:RES family NAD+ phosphorylase [Pseudomonadales bacterium]